jgi:HEAT repeat protein
VAHRDQTAFIRENLKNDSPLVREAAVMLLVRASKFHAAPEIASLLGDSTSSVRAAAVTALGKLQARDFTPAIARLMLEDPDAFVRESAASALDSMHARDAFPHFLRAVKDESPGVRFVVARSLGRLGIDEARPVLRELAQSDPNSNVRLHAIRALGFLASPEDVVFLEDLHTKEGDTEVAQSICEAIDNISKGNRRLRF